MRTVESHPAIRWDCPDCGRENFDRARNVVFRNPDDEEVLKDHLDVPPNDNGVFLAIPDNVTCRQCLSMFEPR